MDFSDERRRELLDWKGALDAGIYRDEIVESSDRLADAARDGKWDVVLDLVRNPAPWDVSVNQWRITGTSWFSPLHQAAWLGAPRSVVDELVTLGAWRSLRTADGERAIDLAQRRGHNHLVDALSFRTATPSQHETFQAWDRHLVEVITGRTYRMNPVRYRPMPTEVLILEELEYLWFGYPGMSGGFRVSNPDQEPFYRPEPVELPDEDYLYVTSWFRLVGGSTQVHFITKDGWTLALDNLL